MSIQGRAIILLPRTRGEQGTTALLNFFFNRQPLLTSTILPSFEIANKHSSVKERDKERTRAYDDTKCLKLNAFKVFSIQ